MNQIFETTLRKLVEVYKDRGFFFSEEQDRVIFAGIPVDFSLDSSMGQMTAQKCKVSLFTFGKWFPGQRMNDLKYIFEIGNITVPTTESGILSIPLPFGKLYLFKNKESFMSFLAEKEIGIPKL